jgi:CheY-like chemotaxis protein
MMADLDDVVLVIEDHEDLREGFRIALMLDGFTVVVAANGREALAKLYAGLRPFLIVMDLMMPVMDGFEFRQAQLADADLAKIPLIAYSGVTDPRETALHLRAEAYLHKPTDVEQVAALVRQFRPKQTPSARTP